MILISMELFFCFKFGYFPVQTFISRSQQEGAWSWLMENFASHLRFFRIFLRLERTWLLIVMSAVPPNHACWDFFCVWLVYYWWLHWSWFTNLSLLKSVLSVIVGVKGESLRQVPPVYHLSALAPSVSADFCGSVLSFQNFGVPKLCIVGRLLKCSFTGT